MVVGGKDKMTLQGVFWPESSMTGFRLFSRSITLLLEKFRRLLEAGWVSWSRHLPKGTWGCLRPHWPPLPSPFPGCPAGQAQSGGCRQRVAQKGKGKRTEEDGNRGQAAEKSTRTGGFQGAHSGCPGATGPGWVREDSPVGGAGTLASFPSTVAGTVSTGRTGAFWHVHRQMHSHLDRGHAGHST